MKEFITKIFNYESDPMRFITLLCNITLLNIIWLICCIPIVTAGASTMAQYYAISQLIDGNTHVVRNFKAGFKQHWKKATVTWIIFAFFLVIFYMDYVIVTTTEIPGKTLLTVVSFLAFITLLMTMMWVFPVMLNFKGNMIEILFNSFMFAFIYVPFTLVAVGFYALTVYLCIHYPLVLGMVFAFGQGLIVFGILLVFDRAFKKYRE